MTQKTLPRSGTDDDLLAAQPGLVAEIVRGARRLRERAPETCARTALGDALTSPSAPEGDARAAWRIVDQPLLRLGGDALVPALAGWRRARLAALPRAAQAALAPDWVCELLAPSTRAINKCDKRGIYREHGVGWLWHIDLEARVIEVFDLHDGLWRLTATQWIDVEIRLPPFDGLGVALSDLWSEAIINAEDSAGCG